MIESRPDWCISRQRAWGVPIAIFVNKQSGEPLRDQAVMDRVVSAFEREVRTLGMPRRPVASSAPTMIPTILSKSPTS